MTIHSIRILMPVYNDWASVARLLSLLDDVGRQSSLTFSVTLVDDWSSDARPALLGNHAFSAIDRIEIVRLARNLGHQRAICIGLCHLESACQPTPIVVMDSDGEDRPEDVAKLVNVFLATEPSAVVFAERSRRTESLLFRVFYEIYCGLHLLLVGHRVRVGNFSVVPACFLSALVLSPDLWNHYAAAVYEARIPKRFVPTVRGTRLAGRSHMDFEALVAHGLSALAVFVDRIAVRCLAAVAVTVLVILCGIGVVGCLRLFTNLPMPGGATDSVFLLMVLVPQLTTLAAMILLLTLAKTSGMKPVPRQFYRMFITQITECDAEGDGDGVGGVYRN